MFSPEFDQRLEWPMTISAARPYTNALLAIQGATRAYAGDIRIEDSPQSVRAVIKPCSPEELAKEAFANSLAKALGLEAPDQYVVDISDFREWERRFKRRYVYACFLVHSWSKYDPRLLRFTLSSTNPLLKWKQLPLAVLFDEWIANGDRTPQNLMFSGVDQFMLIDNEQGFPGHLSASEAQGANFLASHFFNQQDDALKQRMQQVFRAIQQARMIRFESLEFPALRMITGCPEQIERCRDFVQQRWPHLPDLLRARSEVLGPDLFSI